MSALNFVLPHSLGGGGIASLRFDPQVSTYALHKSSSCRPPLQLSCPNKYMYAIYACMHVFILLPQGKGYGQMLADLEVENAPALE